jgi:hypothetical protein
MLEEEPRFSRKSARLLCLLQAQGENQKIEE